jgi:hypothetical protein
VPARLVGWMCRCGLRLPDGPAPLCGACGRKYLESRDADGGKVLAPREAE